MIEFLSLLFGISVGVVPVEIAVSGPVTEVELRLDGRLLERREEAPWVFVCDFGTELQPHELVVVGYNAAGEEVDRKRQWINYSGKSRDAVLALETNDEGAPRRGRVVWRSALQRKPLGIHVAFDGQEIVADSKGQFELPGYDFAAPHHLQAEVELPGEESVRAEAIFGGGFGEQITTALTTVLVVVPEGGELPPSDELKGWIEAAGEPVSIFSTQTAGGSVILVRDHSVGPAFKTLRRQRREQVFAKAGRILEPGQKAAFILTSPLRGDPQGAFRVFPASRARAKAGLWSLLVHNYPHIKVPSRQRLWLSISLAGIKAENTQEPRAVVLVLSKRPTDSSPITFEQAQAFLRHLRVPLFVWAPEASTFEHLKSAVPVGIFLGADGMLELFAAVQGSLARQRMVWIEGEFLPDEVTLTERAMAEGVRLAF